MREALLQDAVLNDCGSILTVKDINFRYISFNNSFLNFLGENNQLNILNKTVYEIFDNCNAKLIERYSNQIIKTKKQTVYNIKFNNKIYKVNSYPVIREGKLNSILSSACDISKEENQKLKLIQKVRRLNSIIEKSKELDEQKEMFMATLTHDLKNPLQSQISALELLNKGAFGNLSDNQKDVLNMLIESSKFMKELLYSVLTVYKYDNGLVELHKTKFDLNETVNNCLSEIECLAKDKNIRLEYKNLTDDYFITADESHIRRVISNILNNAVNYAFKDTLISIIITQEKNNVSIKIKSISSKIPENIKEHIFDKYISGMNSDRKLGIGLGLYFCKKVIEAHQGKIYLNSNNIENEFIINLPIELNEIIKEKLSFRG